MLLSLISLISFWSVSPLLLLLCHYEVLPLVMKSIATQDEDDIRPDSVNFQDVLRALQQVEL